MNSKYLILAVLTLMQQLDLSVSTCCPSKTGSGCCSMGSCSVFCCNCNAGCRSDCETMCKKCSPTNWKNCSYYPCKTQRRKRTTSITEKKLAWERFFSVDLNKNLLIELDEAISYLTRADSKYGNRSETSWFHQIDTNRNGVIDSFEFDEQLAA